LHRTERSEYDRCELFPVWFAAADCGAGHTHGAGSGEETRSVNEMVLAFREIGPKEETISHTSGETAMAYRYEAKSIDGFVQQLAVSYVANGYFFFVTGVIPEGKNQRHVDEKLIAKYGIDVSKFTRARRKAHGQANVQYLRFGRFSCS
jgi:hypothetical protein